MKNDLWCECGLRAVLRVYTRYAHRGWRGDFETRLLFVMDVERCLSRMNAGEARLFQLCVFDGVTQTQAAKFIGISRHTCVSRWGALETKLIALFLAEGLIQPTPEGRHEKATRNTTLHSARGTGPNLLRAADLGQLRRYYRR